MKLSQWHKGSVKPVHVGWYECVGELVCDVNGKIFRHWNGRNWEWITTQSFQRECDKPGLRKGVISFAAVSHRDKWRGIVKDKK